MVRATRHAIQPVPPLPSRNPRPRRPGATETRSGRAVWRQGNGSLTDADMRDTREQVRAMDAGHGRGGEHRYTAGLHRRQRVLLPAARREQPLGGAVLRVVWKRWKGTALTKAPGPSSWLQTGSRTMSGAS